MNTIQNSLVCTPDLDQTPFMIDVQDIPGGAAGSGKVTLKNNYASSGGGALFVKCIMPGGVTKEMGKATPEEVGFYPTSGFARFAFSGNVAGYGSNTATLPQELVLHEPDAEAMARWTAYRPGELITTELHISDSFGQQVRMDGTEKLPVTVTSPSECG